MKGYRLVENENSVLNVPAAVTENILSVIPVEDCGIVISIWDNSYSIIR